MIRVQFSLRTVFVVMTACALLLGWWAPADSGVRFANISFLDGRQDGFDRRITTDREFDELIGGMPHRPLQWPDFAKSDVIAVPANGLAGEPTAEYRVPALDKPVEVDFRNTSLEEAIKVFNAQAEPGKGLLQVSVSADPKMRITFRARGITLREALHSMLEPRGLTFVISPLTVLITTQSDARKAHVTCFIGRTGAGEEIISPELHHRLRLRGKLALITQEPFNSPDSGALGYTLPKGAKAASRNNLPNWY
jgi:hypothetical protein